MKNSADPVTSTLSARGVGVKFEGLRALESVDLELTRGEILGLIGPNGAGKTTLVNVLSGFQQPTEGKVLFEGVDASNWPPHVFPRNGIARTFQAARLFPELTVFENVEMPAVGLGFSRTKARAQAIDILRFLGLEHRGGIAANALAYGEERLVGVARALALNPRFLLLDEPAAGLSPHEATELIARIGSIRDRYECGVLIIEHNMNLIMRVCHRVQVLARGKTIAVGTPQEVQQSATVRESYLGTTHLHEAGERIRSRSPAAGASSLLSVRDLVVDYGSVRALSGVSCSVREGEFVSVIGPNGAGKSTLLSAIVGLVRPLSGEIEYGGSKLRSEGVSQRVLDGIVLVPEGRRILSNLTVEENLKVGETTQRNSPGAADRFEQVLERFPTLRARIKAHAGKLSGGEQQQLAIARALLAKPRLLLLDEPSLGLAPLMIEQVYETLAQLHADGLTILLMEQNANRALLASSRAYVIRHGAIELEGPTEKLRTDPQFDRAYFGFDTSEGIATH